MCAWQGGKIQIQFQTYLATIAGLASPRVLVQAILDLGGEVLLVFAVDARELHLALGGRWRKLDLIEHRCRSHDLHVAAI